MNKTLLGIIIIAMVVIGILVYGVQKAFTPTKSGGNHQTACTQEAKQCPDGSYVSRVAPSCDFAQCPTTPAMKTYTDSTNGFSFQYPESLRTDFASFQFPPKAVVSKTADANGCAGTPLGEGAGLKESKVSMNGINVCLATSSGVGAGQLYNEYDYTFKHNTIYVTLQYVVHTSNGCSAYMGTNKYAGCQDFMAHYDTFITEPIQQSVATLQFTK
jgi:hypothetical protein